MTAFDRDPERNRVANVDDDPAVIAIADQNKAEAIRLLQASDDWFLAIPTDSDIVVACGLRGRDFHWFVNEIRESLDEMAADFEDETGEAA